MATTPPIVNTTTTTTTMPVPPAQDGGSALDFSSITGHVKHAAEDVAKWYLHSALGRAVTIGPPIEKGAADPEKLRSVAAKGEMLSGIEDTDVPTAPGPDPENPINKPFAKFRSGLENMSADMRRFADTHASALTPASRALLHSTAGAMELTPVGGSALETGTMLPLDFSKIPGHVEQSPKPRLGPGKDFYSTLEHHVETKLPEKFSGQQLMSTLKNAGVSKAELEHTRMHEFAGAATLDKKTVLEAAKERAPHVETVEKFYGAPNSELNHLQTKHTNLRENLKRSLVNELNMTDNQASAFLEDYIADPQKPPSWGPKHEPHPKWEQFADKHFDELNDFHVATNKLDDVEDELGEKNDPKYESYTLPGGSNYREVLLQLPAKDARAKSTDPYARRAARVESTEDYQGPHFDEPNVVAHLRLKDRTDVNGKKTLFIEELQSDWARELREQQTKGVTPPSETPSGLDESVPKMPFDKSWHELALKKALHIAASEGYDQVAWTTGEQQADRYNLAKVVDHLTYEPTFQMLLGYKDGKPVVTIGAKPEELSNYIGKEKAQQLLGSKQEIDSAYVRQIKSPMHHLDISDTKLGGEHHLRLYDEMVPQFLNKHTKKWGGQVGETQIEVPNKTAPSGSVTGEQRARGELGSSKQKVQALPITDQMREGVKRGQPLIGADKLDFSSIKGHIEHVPTAEEGESEMERLRRAPPREAPPKTKEEIANEEDRIATREAEERLPKHLGGKAESKEPLKNATIRVEPKDKLTVASPVKSVGSLEPGDMGYMRADGTHVGQPTDPRWAGGPLTHEQLASREHEDLNKVLDAGGVRYRIDSGKINKSPAGSVQIVGLSDKSVTNAKRVIGQMPTDNIIFESYPEKGGKPITIEGTPKEVIAQLNRQVRANTGERYDLGEVSKEKLSGKRPLKDVTIRTEPKDKLATKPEKPRNIEDFTKKMKSDEDHIVQTISRLHNEPLVDLKVGKQTLRGVKLPFDLKAYHGGPDVKKIEARSGDVPGLKSTSLADKQLAEIAAENFAENRPYKPGKVHEISIPKGNYIFYDPEMKLGTTDTATHLRIFKDVSSARKKLSGKKPLKEK